MNTEKTVRGEGPDRDGMIELDFYAYETYCMVRIEERQDGNEILSKCRDIALYVEQLLNMYDRNSELSILCREYRPGEIYRVSALLYDFLKINLLMAELSEGVFDFTVGGLVKRWDFSAGGDEIPSETELLELIETTGYHHIRLIPKESGVIIDMEGITLDPGASGKGFAIDLIVDYLKKREVQSACLDFGGNLYVMGEEENRSCSKNYGEGRQRPGAAGWRIGIRQPADTGRMMALLTVKDQAVSTSSWYEHYIEKEGEVYCHLLDPRNGKPAHSGLTSVTVLSDRAIAADMLSTAMYVMGETQGKKVAQKLEECMGIQIQYVVMKHV